MMLGNEMLGELMGPDGPMGPNGPMGPGGRMGSMFGPGFDLDEIEAMGDALEQLDVFGIDKEAIEREIEAIERELSEELMRELRRGFGFDGFAPSPAPSAPMPAPAPIPAPTAPSSSAAPLPPPTLI